MTIKEAKKFEFFQHDQEDIEKHIDKIYADFKNKTCSNCKLLNDGIGCEIYPCAWTWLSVHENEFGCNQWKSK